MIRKCFPVTFLFVRFLADVVVVMVIEAVSVLVQPRAELQEMTVFAIRARFEGRFPRRLGSRTIHFSGALTPFIARSGGDC